ncbi:carbohydrate-binding protein [Streptomyces sp. KR80]|uniref:carbohydrate-binding protein n=1 Tax=Streptomyces sp. KR80 TaxID=3457426 RepID=UPI003FCF7226
MTAGNTGAGTPENDDPFAYLYRSEGGDADADAAPRTGGYGYPHTAPQPGVPRTSYNQVSRVGERRYGGGQQAPQSPYGAQPANPHYAAPETLPGGAPRQPAPSHGGAGHGGGRGPNSRALLIAAIAVVVTVLMGIGVALLTGGEDKGSEAQNPSPTDKGQDQPGDDPGGNDDQQFTPKKVDAASLRLGGPAAIANDVPNARSRTGRYVTMNAVGATVTWSVNVPKDGEYTLFTAYGVGGEDANATLTVNGTPRAEPLKLANYAKAEDGQWDRGWTDRYDWLQLNKGTNTLVLSCNDGNQCAFNLDYVQLKAGHVKD